MQLALDGTKINGSAALRLEDLLMDGSVKNSLPVAEAILGLQRSLAKHSIKLTTIIIEKQ